MRMLIAIILVAAVLSLAGCAALGGSGQTAAPPNGSPPNGQQQAQQPAAQQQQAQGNEVPPAPPSGTISPAVKEFTIEASQWQFTPSTITVNRGDTVKITLVSKDVAHGIGMPDFGFSLMVPAGGTATGQFTADKAGTFGFRCNIPCGEGHREMTGTLVVQ